MRRVTDVTEPGIERADAADDDRSVARADSCSNAGTVAHADTGAIADADSVTNADSGTHADARARSPSCRGGHFTLV